MERDIGETVQHVQARVEELSTLTRTLTFDCAAEECHRRATYQIEIRVVTARFELPACADHAELVRLGWRGELWPTTRPCIVTAIADSRRANPAEGNRIGGKDRDLVFAQNG